MRTQSTPQPIPPDNSGRRPGVTATEPPLLSIVVPAYNEEGRLSASLRRMLEYFDAQDYTYEILVVDDGSSDGTAARVQDIVDVHDHVFLLSYMPNQGKGHAVRHGMLQAKGARILFSDGVEQHPLLDKQGR